MSKYHKDHPDYAAVYRERKPSFGMTGQGNGIMSRPSYKAALKWIAVNDDCEWLHDKEPMISVAAALVAYFFGKTDYELIRDLIKVHSKEWEGS